MTREAKIDWLRKASNEELIGQMKSTVVAISAVFHTDSTLAQQIELQEDYELVTAEMLRRMAK